MISKINKRLKHRQSLTNLFFSLIVYGIAQVSFAQSNEMNNDKIFHHSFYIGGNLKFAPLENLIIIDPTQQIDPTYPGATSALIKPTGSFKLGYGIKLKIIKSLHLNGGLEINQRRYGFTINYDSTVSISQLRSVELFNNIEIPLSISYRFGKLRLSGGTNFIFITQRNSIRYNSDTKNSWHATLGIFPRLESEYFLFPFVSVDYRIYETPDVSYFISGSVELQEYLGRSISLSLIADLR